MAALMEVTQADRNAAIRLLEAGGLDYPAKEIRIGDGDGFPLVQAFARHRLAHSEPRPVAGEVRCGASPDHADILETIANAADDWQAKGYTSSLAEVRDMANVGRALMEALPEGYSYMNCPSEIVSDLQNDLADALFAAPKAASEDDCTCQRHPTHCANDCPTHGLDGESYTAGEPNHAKAASEDGATGLRADPLTVARAGGYMGAITKGSAFLMDYGQEGVEELVRIADVLPADDVCCKVRLAGTTFWIAEFDFRRRATSLAASPTDATGVEMRERCAAFLEARGDELLAVSPNKSTGNMMREISRAEAQSIRNLPVAGETL